MLHHSDSFQTNSDRWWRMTNTEPTVEEEKRNWCIKEERMMCVLLCERSESQQREAVKVRWNINSQTHTYAFDIWYHGVEHGAAARRISASLSLHGSAWSAPARSERQSRRGWLLFSIFAPLLRVLDVCTQRQNGVNSLRRCHERGSTNPEPATWHTGARKRENTGMERKAEIKLQN